MMDRLRFAVVGCGAVATQYHLPAIVRSPQARLVAVVDSNLGWAKSVARHFGVGFASADYRDLPGRVDAALIATPNLTHAEISCYLLDHGVHVLCEKPVATTATDARRMFSTAEASSARLMAGQSRRFSPQIQFLRQLFWRGYLNKTGTLMASLGEVYGSWPSRTDFRLKRDLAGGGVMMDQGVHLIDMALWLFDDRPVHVDYYETETRDWGIEDDAELTLTFRGGGHALLAMSYTHGMRGTLTYTGPDGWVKAGVNSNIFEFYLDHSRLCRIAGVQEPVLDSTSPYVAQLEHFCASVRSGEPFLVRSDQVILGLEVIEACYAHPGRFSMAAA